MIDSLQTLEESAARWFAANLTNFFFPFVNPKSSMPARYKYFISFFLVKSCCSDDLESFCYYGFYSPLLTISLCFPLFSAFISMLAVVNDIKSTKSRILNPESWILAQWGALAKLTLLFLKKKGSFRVTKVAIIWHSSARVTFLSLGIFFLAFWFEKESSLCKKILFSWIIFLEKIFEADLKTWTRIDYIADYF